MLLSQMNIFRNKKMNFFPVVRHTKLSEIQSIVRDIVESPVLIVVMFIVSHYVQIIEQGKDTVLKVLWQ